MSPPCVLVPVSGLPEKSGLSCPGRVVAEVLQCGSPGTEFSHANYEGGFG